MSRRVDGLDERADSAAPGKVPGLRATVVENTAKLAVLIDADADADAAKPAAFEDLLAEVAKYGIADLEQGRRAATCVRAGSEN